MEIIKYFIKMYSGWNCFAQTIFVSLLTIAIIAIIRIWFKPKNKKIFEWMTLAISFLIMTIINLIIIFNFTHRLDISIITQEILLILGTPVFTKIIYDIAKPLIFSKKEQNELQQL